jgi:microcystin-dependent protein
MANVQHNTLGGGAGTGDKNLHVPGFWGSTDPAVTDPTQVQPGTYWVDTRPGLGKYLLRVRNQNNNGWDLANAQNLIGAASPWNVITGDLAYNHVLVDASDAGPKLWHHKIDDTAITVDKLWSASKIYTHTNNALIHRSINDSGVSTTDLWSAAKIIAQLALKQNVVAAGQLVPTGTIIEYGGWAIPAGYLICDGSAISRTTYAALYTAISTLWGSGNGSTTFNVPDLRGRFLRMMDWGSGRDPDVFSRTACNPGGAVGANVGTVQDHQLKSHTHGLHQGSSTGVANYWVVKEDWSTILNPDEYISIIPAGGNETRPVNAAVSCAIKI